MAEHEHSRFLATAEAAAFLSLHPRILESMRSSAAVDQNGSPYLTVAEAAAYLRLKPRTLDNMRGNCTGPIYTKHGGRIFYSFADVVAWSKARRRRSTAEKAT